MKQSSGTFKCVRYYDPAIDWPDDGGELSIKYAQFRDIDTLKFVDPAQGKPMIFWCRRLSRDQRKNVTTAEGDHWEMMRRCFRFGVLRVENYVNDSGDTETYVAKRKEDAEAADVSVLDDFGDVDVREIGNVIWGQSFLARGVPLRLRLLDTSQDAYLTVRYLSAEQRKTA